MCRVQPTGPRIGSDVCLPLIALYNALQNGWTPPEQVTEADYQQAKSGNCEPYLQAFIGFGCSFAGKWFGGFARGGHGADAPTAARSLRSNLDRNYAANARNSLLKKSVGMSDVRFNHLDYRNTPFKPEGWVIYCDPPYAGTTGYTAAPPYNPAEFWVQCSLWAGAGNVVLVSEYQAPADWTCVLEVATKTDIRNRENQLEPRQERLFSKVAQVIER